MHYRAVIDQFGMPPVLDPFSAALFCAAFVLVALLVVRRPAYGLVALIVSAPAAFYHDMFAITVTLPKVVLLGVFAGLFAHPGTLRRWREPPSRAVLLALGAYALATALSFITSAYPGTTLHELAKVFEYAAFFAAGYACFRNDPDGELAVRAIAVAAAIVCATALAQEALGAPSGLCVGDVVIPRIAGLIEGPNQLAGYLEVCLAVLLAWNAAKPSRAIGLVVALATTTAVLTFSRAGIAAIVVVMAITWLAYRRGALASLAWAGGGLVAGAAGIAMWASILHAGTVFRISMEASKCAGGVGNRTELYRAAWTMWQAHPFFGVGAGNFELLLPLVGVLGVRTHANSWYLQSLAEGGVVLFAATIGLIATILGIAWKALRESPWIVAAFAATVALALHQIVDYLIFYPKVAEPWLLVVAIGAATLACARSRSESR